SCARPSGGAARTAASASATPIHGRSIYRRQSLTPRIMRLSSPTPPAVTRGLDPAIYPLRASAKIDGLPGHKRVYARVQRAMSGNDGLFHDDLGGLDHRTPGLQTLVDQLAHLLRRAGERIGFQR